jgi:hypothetical protein
MPAFLILLLNIFFSDAFDRRLIFGAVGRGLLWFFPALVVYGILTGSTAVYYEGTPLYLTRTVSDFFLPLFLGSAVYVFSYRTDLIISGKEQFVRTASFLAGFYTLFSQYVLITFRGWYEGYVYFILPLCWMVLIMTAGVVTALFFSVIGGIRFLFVFIGILIVFLLGSVSYLYLLNLRVYAWLLAAALFLAGLAALRRVLEAVK